jgi:hypothetical protein
MIHSSKIYVTVQEIPSSVGLVVLPIRVGYFCLKYDGFIPNKAEEPTARSSVLLIDKDDNLDNDCAK